MNAQSDSLASALAADPLASVRMGEIADLAFGSATVDVSHGGGGHLALLTTDALELDLSDPLQRQFGDYELLELVGEGGMGVVYRARQRSLDREVAVKLLAAGPWASKTFIERFRFEAQNAARMQHPNIVAIYEVGSAEELHFFSMRLVRGGSLAAMLRHDKKLRPRQAAALVRTVAEAVDYAHRLGVLHLDLKPANVLVDENGVPHVADFGLARRLEQGLAAGADEVSGTPSYMAPEQTRGKSNEISPATDIWGLGAVLYELVTGRPPFLGDSPQATLKQVVEGRLIAPRELLPTLPRDLDAIILKCMAPNAVDRYASARSLADDLAAFGEGRMVKARPLNAMQRTGRWARREPRLAMTAVFAFATLLAGLTATTQQWRRAEDNALTSRQQSWKSRRESALRLQLDGKAFEALPLLVQNIEEQDQAKKSADIERREVGMILHQGVTLIDRMIIPDAHPITASLSPDGSLLAIGLDDVSVRWYDTKTLALRGQVDLSDLPTSDGASRVPLLLRFVDNHRMRVTLEWPQYVTSPSENDTYLLDLDAGKIVQPPPEFKNFSSSGFNANASYAILHSGEKQQLWQVDPWRPLQREPYVYPFSMPGLLTRGATLELLMEGSANNMAWVDPLHPELHHAVSLPNHGALVAWRENNAGTQIALGDNEGRVFVFDMVTRTIKQLPTSTGGSVNWLAYSEDDAWLAAVRGDGAAYAFDTATGSTLHSGDLRNDFPLHNASISHRDRLLVASGYGETAVWRMPEAGAEGVDAARLIANPTRSDPTGQYWIGAAMHLNLLASADMDGEVRLWRLPNPIELPLQKPTLAPSKIDFDGKHVVDVAYNRLRVASIDEERATPWVDLPQPIQFAALTGDGATVMATAGRLLYVYDATTMHPRYAPVELPATPQRFVCNRNGSLLTLSFGFNSDTGFHERLLNYNTVTGRQADGSAVVVGPLRQLELSPDESRLLATGSFNGGIDVFESATLHRIGSYANERLKPVLWAGFTDDSAQLWFVARDMDDTRGNDTYLTRWKIADETVQERRRIPGVYPIGLTVVGGKPLLAASDRLILDPGTAFEQSTARLFGGKSTTTFAVSHDRKLIAHAYGRSVRLYDAATLEAVGAPLATDSRSFDVVTNLAFADDASSLLARAENTASWLLWNLPNDTREVGAIAADAELLAPAKRGGRILRMATLEEREGLRTRDPGAPRLQTSHEFKAARLIDGMPVPARDPHTSPLMLDLTDFYNIAPRSVRPLINTVMPATYALPLGVVRLGDTDYDIRGCLELRFEGPQGAMPGDNGIRKKVTGIPVPATAIAALHVLLFAQSAEPRSTEVLYASIRVHYNDGTQAVLPMRIQHELPGWTEHDRPVPFAWVMDQMLAVTGNHKQQIISNPRLPNPHPEKMISSIDLETPSDEWSEPVFFAITAEPVIAHASSGTLLEQHSDVSHSEHEY